WRCTRGRACGAVELLVYAAGRDALDIEGLGEKLAHQLVDQGLVVDLADIYDLRFDQVRSLERMGDLSTRKLLANIEAAKSQPLDRQLTALGLRMTGRQLCRRLSRHFGTLDALRRATVEDLAEVEGLGELRAAFIIDDLNEIDDLLDRLVAAGINTEDDLRGSEAAEPSDLPLDGLTIVVSGTMTGALEGLNRTEINDLIERHGGRATGSVSSSTSFLVTNE